MPFIDLSHPLDPNTPPYPGDPPFLLTKNTSLKADGYTSHTLSSAFHAGTHIEAPMHLIEDSRFLVDFPINHFAGRGVVLDVRDEKRISYKPLYDTLVHPQDIVLLFSGFDSHYPTKEYFSHHPCVEEELAAFFLYKQIKILGMDFPSPDHFPHGIHKQLFQGNILLLENLTNLSSLLPLTDFEIMAFPLPIAAEASFVRVVAKKG
ncbi:MAG: cyclase family protein [Clostridiales bacterium]|nr:cyclase family protein [Clostridiales bacterium]